MTMLTFNSNNPKSCGVILRDNKMRVSSFFEKVDNPPSNIANAAIYLFDDAFIKLLDQSNDKLYDFSKDVIPKFIGKIYTYHTNKDFIDIGTINNLERAQKFLNCVKNFKNHELLIFIFD